MAKFLNINFAYHENEEETKVSDLYAPVELLITLPEAYINQETGMVREFSVVRIHDGKAEVLKDLDQNGKTVTISTDKFSTYALMYKDTVKTTSGNLNPTTNGTGTQVSTLTSVKTGDQAPILLYIGLLLTGASVIVMFRKKRAR
ncbi:MAG TPA: LPXTG cell wall anchor domain-containing protein [Candidatus Merdenecus merdavium]|nr:LPXTG cell wall anchor domain-containing protein [Candidatus Merdenecus merdavium]